MRKSPISSPPTHAPNKARATAQPKALARDQRQCSRISRRRRRRPPSSRCRVRACVRSPHPLPLPAQNSLASSSSRASAVLPIIARGGGVELSGAGFPFGSVVQASVVARRRGFRFSLSLRFDSIRCPRVAGVCVGGIFTKSFTGVSGIHEFVCRLASRRSENQIESKKVVVVSILSCRIVVVGCAVVSWWDS